MHFANVIEILIMKSKIYMELKNMKQEETEGGGLLWADLEVGSWFINTNHRQFSNYYIYSGFAIIPHNCNFRDETIDIITT